MSFAACPGTSSHTGWQGEGQASVQVAADDLDLWLVEQGAFRPISGSTTLIFHNTYRWQKQHDSLRLFHERFGPTAPVWLLDMVPVTPWRLSDRVPHSCGADRYHATLELTRRGLALHWIILGPAKEEYLTYHYS